jgi:hypothetical protein
MPPMVQARLSRYRWAKASRGRATWTSAPESIDATKNAISPDDFDATAPNTRHAQMPLSQAMAEVEVDLTYSVTHRET